MSEWIARFLGPVFIVAAIPMIVTPHRIGALNESFLGNRALVYVTGLLVLVAGLAIVNTHNLWVADWRLIITLFGWALTLGGAARVILPEPVKRVGDRMSGTPSITRIVGVLWAALGVLLAFKGYL
jgi:hypothetical protein